MQRNHGVNPAVPFIDLGKNVFFLLTLTHGTSLSRPARAVSHVRSFHIGRLSINSFKSSSLNAQCPLMNLKAGICRDRRTYVTYRQKHPDNEPQRQRQRDAELARAEFERYEPALGGQ